MSDWLQKIHALSNTNSPCVLVTVAHTAASAPREAGTRMVVAASDVYGTIGGGNLEFKAIETARHLLGDSKKLAAENFLEVYALGSMLEQCCGGVVFLHYELLEPGNSGWVDILHELAQNSVSAVTVTRTGEQDAGYSSSEKLIVTEFETHGSLGELDEAAIVQARNLIDQKNSNSQSLLQSLSSPTAKRSLPDIKDALLFDLVPACDFHIVLFGAGHVGSAIVNVLEKSLDCRINWVDSREHVFPETLADSVTKNQSSMPTNIVGDMPANSFYLVMTHNHALDLALCEAILKRDNFQYLGLIGSETKRKRFRKQLKAKQISDKGLSRMTCPIGVNGIASKEPGAIAVSVVAQLLQIYEHNKQLKTEEQGGNNVISL